MPNASALSKTKTRRSTQRGYSDALPERNNSTRTASRPGGLKRARLLLEQQHGDDSVDSGDNPENPHALCAKTIFAQQEDLTLLQQKDIKSERIISLLRYEKQLLTTRLQASQAGCCDMIRVLDDCQGLATRLQESLDASLEPANLMGTSAETTQKSATLDPTWTHDLASTGVDRVTDGEGYGEDFFAINDGHLFDLPMP